MNIFEKEYDGETIIDIEEDVYDAINYRDLPANEHGILEGYFTVTVSWRKDYE